MAMLLSGKDVVATLNETLCARAAALRAGGVVPTLAIVRVGERPDDISYETGATKRCEKLGVAVRRFLLPQDAAQPGLLGVIDEINRDGGIHGCLLFRPLPSQFDEERVRNALAPQKDVDGITDGSLASVFASTDKGFPPCTPQACMEMLDHFGIDVKGKRAVVIGRSLVAGKPAAMMLLKRNATVTICHTRTVDMPAVCREAEVLIVAAGRAGIIGKEYLSQGQTIIDVGIHVNGDGKLCGDVNFAEAESLAGAITPVPGGVGTVTTSVLVKHVIEAAERTVLA